MSLTFENKSKLMMQELGICSVEDVKSVFRLAGGVASDIAKISYHDQVVCVKFALAKLKVKEDWYAPIHRGRAEYAWLKVVGKIAPHSAPRLFGWSDTYSGFAMEFLGGKDTYLWKDALLEGRLDQGEAEAVGHVLGRVHAASTRNFDTKLFDNADDFNELRLSPYLRFTAIRHPAVADIIVGLANSLYEKRTVIVHGDVSPKNIMFRSGNPVILDAECATMGDPSFDVAFCLNHLVLKSIHLPESRQYLLEAVSRFWTAYASHVKWEPVGDVEARAVALLPALMLARVDGKSPVEYLSGASQAFVRAVSLPLIQHPEVTMSEFLTQIEQGDL